MSGDNRCVSGDEHCMSGKPHTVCTCDGGMSVASFRQNTESPTLHNQCFVSTLQTQNLFGMSGHVLLKSLLQYGQQ